LQILFAGFRDLRHLGPPQTPRCQLFTIFKGLRHLISEQLRHIMVSIAASKVACSLHFLVGPWRCNTLGFNLTCFLHSSFARVKRSRGILQACGQLWQMSSG
ncbi:hypothetical protein KC19_11G104600, partial [Ceratodon purpureus]